MSTTREEYIKRISLVLDYIEKNLDDDLSLEALSQKACYSSFHFHRVFSTITGENVNQYVNRKRIERIASILITGTATSIKALAYTYGFNSESSFSRAFRKFYGISPTQFKSDGQSLLSKIGIEPFSAEKYICDIDNIHNWMKMNAQIVVSKLSEIKLAGITHIGEFDKIGDMYQSLIEWGHKKDLLPTATFKAITIYHDNPHVTPNPKVRYSACISIARDFKAEGEIRPLSIQKGIYAIGSFEINAEEIPAAWKGMCLWVMENGYEFRDADYFEIYVNDHKTHPEQKFLIDICIPLEKTDNLKFDHLIEANLSPFKDPSMPSGEALGYHELIKFMKELRTYFDKEYGAYFKLGQVYQGNPDYSYLSLTTEELKKMKLKFGRNLRKSRLNGRLLLSAVEITTNVSTSRCYHHVKNRVIDLLILRNIRM